MEITGFDQQIGVLKKIQKKITSKVMPIQNKLMPKKVQVPVKSTVVNKLMPKKIQVPVKSTVVNKLMPKKIQVPVKSTVVNKLMPKKIQVPVKKSPILTAKQFTSIQNKVKAQTLSKSNDLLKMNDVQRSFAKVDLPYQKVTPATKLVKVKNTPLNLPINVNMIEPPVDSGVQDYYGK